MLANIRKLSLEKQLFFSFLSISAFLLLFSLSITLLFDMNHQKREIDKTISSMAAYISSMDRVTDMLEAGYPDPAAERELDSIYREFPDISSITICDTNGLRFYHTNRQKSGETLIQGAEQDILSGSSPYITVGYGTMGSQRQAFHAIRSQEDVIIGFVMVSVFTNHITSQVQQLLCLYVLIVFVMLVLSILLSHGLVCLLHDSLMGHHPQELLELYLKQDTVLNAMSEGIIATDKTGSVIFANQAAKELVSGELPINNQKISSFFPLSRAEEIVKDGIPTSQKRCLLCRHPLIYSELPIGSMPDIQGVLTIFNDLTEVEQLSDQLSGAHSMLDTMRAFNHEFLNKLHIILGYLQTGEIDRAISFIVNSSLVSSDAIRKTAGCIRVSRICALVIGKMMHAAELGITLSTAPESRCHESDLFLPEDVYLTIIGNLLENAIEELAAAEQGLREISLGLYASEDCTIITCEDTGRGIDPAIAARIFEKGVSTKGEHRGTGLFLVSQLTKDLGGELTFETEAGVGTCFTVTFTNHEHEENV